MPGKQRVRQVRNVLLRAVGAANSGAMAAVESSLRACVRRWGLENAHSLNQGCRAGLFAASGTGGGEVVVEAVTAPKQARAEAAVLAAFTRRSSAVRRVRRRTARASRTTSAGPLGNAPRSIAPATSPSVAKPAGSQRNSTDPRPPAPADVSRHDSDI